MLSQLGRLPSAHNYKERVHDVLLLPRAKKSRAFKFAKIFLTYNITKAIALGLFTLFALLIAPVSEAATVNSDLAERALTAHTGEIFALAFSPDNRWLASGAGDNTIRLWEPATGREMRLLRGHLGAIRALVFAPDNKILASAASDATIRTWDVTTGQELKALPSRFGTPRAVAFSPEGQLVATGGDDGTVRI